MMKMSMAKEVSASIAAKCNILWIEGSEEERILGEIMEEIGSTMKVFVWSISSGLRVRLAPADVIKLKRQWDVIDANMGPDDALNALRAYSGGENKATPALFVFCELDELMKEDVSLRRSVREVVMDKTLRMGVGRHIMVVTPRPDSVPQSFAKDATVIQVKAPTREQLVARIISFQTGVSAMQPGFKSLNQEDIDRVANAATGLTMSAFERALRFCVSQFKGLDGRAIDVIGQQKKKLVDGTGFLQYEEPAATLSDVGGQDLLKKWLAQRMKAFGPEARKYGLTEPKGVLTVGPPGTGKSLGAKAASANWGRPLIRLDVGALFGGLVGESESNTRRAIDLIEAMSPCVLWIDEIEKGLSGMSSSGSTDGGTTARVFQSLLTWLNEKQSAVFVYATANDPSKLPPELLRKGRFDEIFAIMLPTEQERADILSIHISKKGRNPSDYPVAELAKMTAGFSGAELEQAVLDAMFSGFAADREFSGEDLVHAIGSTQPMSTTMAERIEALETWARTRARPATSAISKIATAQPAMVAQAEPDMLDLA